jgi:hypothetical protein
MAYECINCEVTVDQAGSCPKCGSLLRYTVLRDKMFNPEIERKVAPIAKKAGPPGVVARASHVLVGLVVTFVCAALLLFVSVYLFDKAVEGEQYDVSQHPFLTVYMPRMVPVLALLVGVFLSCRGYYLAQLQGAAIGLLSSILFLIGQRQIEGLPQALDFVLLPSVGVIGGFLIGLTVNKPYVVDNEVKLIEIDAWDKGAEIVGDDIKTNSINLPLRFALALATPAFFKLILFGVLLAKLKTKSGVSDEHLIESLLGKCVFGTRFLLAGFVLGLWNRFGIRLAIPLACCFAFPDVYAALFNEGNGFTGKLGPINYSFQVAVNPDVHSWAELVALYFVTTFVGAAVAQSTFSPARNYFNAGRNQKPLALNNTPGASTK